MLSHKAIHLLLYKEPYQVVTQFFSNTLECAICLLPLYFNISVWMQCKGCSPLAILTISAAWRCCIAPCVLAAVCNDWMLCQLKLPFYQQGIWRLRDTYWKESYLLLNIAKIFHQKIQTCLLQEEILASYFVFLFWVKYFKELFSSVQCYLILSFFSRESSYKHSN